MSNDKKDTTSSTASKKSSANKTTQNNGVNATNNATVVAQSTKNKAKTIAIVGVVLLVALLGFWSIRYFVQQSAQPQATLQGETAMRMGQSQVLTFDSQQIKRGQTVCWYVNGERVYCQKYDGRALKYRYSPAQQGVDHIRVDVAGKTYKSMDVSVGKILATVTVNNVVATYGEDIPEFSYTVEGADQQELPNCRIYVEDKPTQVGIYPIKFACDECQNCDFAVTEGTLEIVPRTLTLTGEFAKVYDGTNTIGLEEISLDGVLKGDDVYIWTDTIAYFDNKNVGDDKQILLPNLSLCGDDAANYCVETSNLCGQILPKTITVEGTKIANKHYDGTTKATFECVGNLVGVVDGDVVAIGNCQAAFENCKVGRNKKVCVSNVCLVGRDKGNYTLKTNFDCTGNIEKGYMDLILNKPDVIHGQTKNK